MGIRGLFTYRPGDPYHHVDGHRYQDELSRGITNGTDSLRLFIRWIHPSSISTPEVLRIRRSCPALTDTLGFLDDRFQALGVRRQHQSRNYNADRRSRYRTMPLRLWSAWWSSRLGTMCVFLLQLRGRLEQGDALPQSGQLRKPSHPISQSEIGVKYEHATF